MKQIQLHLIPTPGAKPEFLATLEAASADDQTALQAFQKLPSQILLEAYTRDAWAWKPHPSWISLKMKSVDGRNKVPGFLKYLKERQKSAFGCIKPTGVLSVTYIQPKLGDNIFQCRVAWDIAQIPNCPLVQKKKPVPAAAVASTTRTAPPSNPKKVGGGKSGMLGNLLKGQERTNEHYRAALPTKPKGPVSSGAGQGGAAGMGKTSQDVLTEFRAELEQKLLDFDIAPDNEIKISVSLAEKTRGIMAEDEKAKVTMEVLKYIVYEQAEEVNEDWVAHKEQSEFMDEVVIAIYKEAPPEVLEETQKGDLPDEVRGQQRAIQEASSRLRVQKEAKLDAERERTRLLEDTEDDYLAVLNTEKRDRRTIEEIQKEMQGEEPAKRQRVD